MEIFSELNKNTGLTLALGFFDGVHLGHQAVIKSAVNYAKEKGTKSAVVTFKDHPCCYLWKTKPKYILDRKTREENFKKLCVDFLYELNFEDIAGLTAQDYLKDILINNFMPISISTGWNHNFGYKKSGNTEFLKENSKKYGYEFFEIPAFRTNNQIISSTIIRKHLSEGKIEKSNEMLGHKFFVSGTIIEGNKIGRTIGFKTANIAYPPEIIEIPYGVYAVNTNYGKGIANFGIRPTINGKTPVLETHIIDFDKEIYGKKIKVQFDKMIRFEQKFNSLGDLKSQIQKDIKAIL